MLVTRKVFVQLRRRPLNIVNVSFDAILDAAFACVLHHHRPVQKYTRVPCEVLITVKRVYFTSIKFAQFE